MNFFGIFALLMLLFSSVSVSEKTYGAAVYFFGLFLTFTLLAVAERVIDALNVLLK